MRFHSDDRRRFWGDIFDTPNGDINVVELAHHVPIAWHRHRKQDDHIFLLDGMLEIKMFLDSPNKMYSIMLRNRDEIVEIPRGWWHGYKSCWSGTTTILQFNGPGKWDGTDEERMSLDEIPWNLPTP